LLYFSHDTNASEHPKLLALRAHYGGDRGRAMEQRFWQLNGMIAASSKCRLNITAGFSKPQIAQKLELTLAEFGDFIAFLADPDRCDLIHYKDGLIWTDRVDEELQHYQESNEKERKRKQEERDRKKGDQLELSSPAGQPPFSGIVRPDSSGRGPDNPSNPPGQTELSGRTTSDVTRMSGGKTPFSGEAGRQAGIYKELEQLSPSTSPAAAAVSTPGGSNGEAAKDTSFVAILRIRLAGAAITLPPEELQTAADRLAAMGAADDEYLSYAIERCKKADKKEARSTWFLKGIYEYGWVAKWKSEPKKKPAEPKPVLAPLLEDMKAERERQEADPVLMQKVALDLAHNHQRLHTPLTDDDRKALEAAGESVPAKPAPQTLEPESAEPAAAPLFEEEPTFEDDFPWPEEDSFPDALPEESDTSDATTRGEK
jgi:hypothetical protein